MQPIIAFCQKDESLVFENVYNKDNLSFLNSINKDLDNRIITHTYNFFQKIIVDFHSTLSEHQLKHIFHVKLQTRFILISEKNNAIEDLIAKLKGNHIHDIRLETIITLYDPIDQYTLTLGAKIHYRTKNDVSGLEKIREESEEGYRSATDFQEEENGSSQLQEEIVKEIPRMRRTTVCQKITDLWHQIGSLPSTFFPY